MLPPACCHAGDWHRMGVGYGPGHPLKVEIKQAIEKMTPEERNELQAYLWSVVPNRPIIYSETVEQRMKEMDEGKFVRWSDVRDEFIARETPDE